MLISEIISEAYREAQITAIGASPSTAQQTEGLARLNRYVRALYGHEIGVELCPWAVTPPQRTAPVAAQYPKLPFKNDLSSSQWPYPPSNARIFHSATSTRTVYLQHSPRDGARVGYVKVGATAVLTIDGNGRNVESATTLAVDPSSVSSREWFYRGDLGNWQRIAELQLTDSSPFPDEFDDLLVCGLAVSLSPRYGNEPRKATVRGESDGTKKLMARYRQPAHNTVLSGDLPPFEYGHYDAYDLLNE